MPLIFRPIFQKARARKDLSYGVPIVSRFVVKVKFNAVVLLHFIHLFLLLEKMNWESSKCDSLEGSSSNTNQFKLNTLLKASLFS
jgi:hypothetical protein